MAEYYTRKEAMELLGLRSVNALRQLERKYPAAFLNLNPHHYRAKSPWYDKATLDKFAKAYEHLRIVKT
jgi:hypothetical protein